MANKKAIIIGAGPAGLTAGFELLDRTGLQPVILEELDCLGGISRTVVHRGNRMDIGGHRFFSKVDRVMDWWLARMPLQGVPARDYRALGVSSPVSDLPGAPDPEQVDRVMLSRNRLSRILFLRKFFDYPISLSGKTLGNLGAVRTVKIGFSYLRARLRPIRPEKSLEDFFINRFGRELYGTFFRDYTEKVWGVPCREIKPEWGAQRIKGLSITKAIFHALKKPFSAAGNIRQKGVETSLIESFFYPKLGPGQMWETVAAEILQKGGTIAHGQKVTGVSLKDGKVAGIQSKDVRTGATQVHEGDVYFSTMPIKDLVEAMGEAVPEDVRDIARNLQYRDFITVGLLVDKLAISNTTSIPTSRGLVPDNWIYVQESDVRVGRLQIFNNWSPYLVSDPEKVWLGLEYFCNEGDDLWTLPDEEMIRLASLELEKIHVASKDLIRDSVVIRVPKAYPAYFGSYDRLDRVIQFLNGIPNLYCIGRNGMHRYNNQDHSMLAAMTAVDNIAAGVLDKANIWSVNTEEDYHETKKSS